MAPYATLRFFLIHWVKRHLANIEGLEHAPTDQPFIVAANHIDFLDPIYFLFQLTEKTGRGVTIISKTKNYYWLRSLTLAIDPVERPKVLERARQYLQQGRIICIFPEGERNPTGTLLQGKTGVARLALFTRMPVVPLGLRGPAGRTFLESAKLLLYNRQPVTVRIGRPMMFPEWYDREITAQLLAEVTKKVMVEIGKLSDKTYNF